MPENVVTDILDQSTDNLSDASNAHVSENNLVLLYTRGKEIFWKRKSHINLPARNISTGQFCIAVDLVVKLSPQYSDYIEQRDIILVNLYIFICSYVSCMYFYHGVSHISAWSKICVYDVN